MEKSSSNSIKEPIEDYKVVSKDCGVIGYEFSELTIELFGSCMEAYLRTPEDVRPDWKTFVKRWM